MVTLAGGDLGRPRVLVVLEATGGEPQPGLDLGGTGGLEQHLVDAPLGRDAGQAALGEDRRCSGDRHARGAQHAAQRAGHGEVATGVEQDRVTRRGVDQRGRLGGDDAHVVRQQAQCRQHLGARRQGVGQQQQTGHALKGYGCGPPAGRVHTW